MEPKNHFIFAWAGLMLGSFALQAAVFPRLTAEDLTAQSQMIVEGDVVRAWAAWDAEHKYIWTHYEVSVKDHIRGSRDATITVSEPGGSLDGVNQQFSGVVAYSPGETAVLFLYQTPIGYWRSVGGPQGKFTVDNGGLVHSNSQASTFLENPASASGTSLASLEGLSVPDFKLRVQRLVAAHPFRGQR